MRPPSDIGKTASSVANWPIVRPQKSKRAKEKVGRPEKSAAEFWRTKRAEKGA
jgi:hypothetical protein